MAKESRPKGYPKLKNYKPSQFMLSTSRYDNGAGVTQREICNHRGFTKKGIRHALSRLFIYI